MLFMIFFLCQWKGRCQQHHCLAALVRLWAALLCKAGQTRSTSMLPRVGTDVGVHKMHLMVAKGKPPAITSYITFPELVMFCFAKSVGSSGTHHFQLRSCNKQGHRFNFQSAFYWLTYSYTKIHWSSSILSLSVSLSLSLSCVWPFILLTGLKYMNIS